MRRPVLITSLDNPRVKQIVRFRDKQRERRQAGVFLAEGFREVGRALEAGLHIRELYLVPELTQLRAADLSVRMPLLVDQRIELYEVTPGVFAKMAHNENPEGLLALVEQPVWKPEFLRSDGPELFLIASGTNKPGNLGAMARTAAAAGATALLCVDSEVDIFNPNAIRASTGAVYTLPILAMTFDETVPFLRARNVRILAATPDAEAAYTRADLRGPLAIVIGAEDSGVEERWLEAADLKVIIPMARGIVDSLNASNAAAILLFEVLRQRAL